MIGVSMQRKTIKEAIPWVVFDSVGSAAISVISLVVLSRLLTPNEFGIIAYAQSIVLLIQAMIGAGLGEALVQRRPIDVIHYDSAFWCALGLGFVGFALCLAGGIYLEIQREQHPVGLILAFEGAACLFAGFNLVPMAILQRKLRSKAIATRMILSKITYVLVAVGLAFLGAGLWSVVAAGALQNIVGTVILWRNTARWPRRRLSWPHLKQLIVFGLPVMLEGTLSAAMNRVFLILVGILHGVETLGFLSLAMRATETVGNILGLLVARLGLPTFSALRGNPDRMKHAFLQATEGMNLLAASTYLGLFVTAPDWVPLVHGSQWLSAVPLIQILCIVNLLVSTMAFVGALMWASGHPRAMLPRAALAGLVTLMAVSLTGGFAYIFVVYAWGSRVLAIVPISLYITRRFGGVPIARQLRAILVPTSLSLAMLGCVMFYRATGLAPYQHLASLLTSSAVGIVSLLAMVLIVYRGQLTVLRTMLIHRKIS